MVQSGSTAEIFSRDALGHYLFVRVVHIDLPCGAVWRLCLVEGAAIAEELETPTCRCITWLTWSDEGTQKRRLEQP